MLLPHIVVGRISVAVIVLGIGAVSGQDYPNRPIRIFTAEAGGGTDAVAREIAQRLAGSLGQQVIVENRPSGIILGNAVAKASPDGYSLLVMTGTLWLGPFMQKTPYDPVRDFAPITFAVRSPNILVVHPTLPANSVKDLIALAKARPGELNYASGGTGGSPHLAAELFKAMAGVSILRIPYKGNAPALIDLISGQVQLMFSTPTGAGPHIHSGRLKAIAVTSAQPSAFFPGLPTVAASGLPGYESVTIYGVFAPAKTPAQIINRLNQEIVRVLNLSDTRERLASSGVDVVGSSPEELAAAVKSEMARMGKIIRDAGIREP